MKGALYLASVVRAYRQAIDRYWETPESYQVDWKWRQDLDSVSHRPYTAGMLFGHASNRDSSVEGSAGYHQTHTLAGIVRPAPESRWETSLFSHLDRKDWTYIEVRSRLAQGMKLEFLGMGGSATVHVLEDFEDLSGTHPPVAHPNTWIRIHPAFPTFPNQVIRMLAHTA